MNDDATMQIYIYIYMHVEINNFPSQPCSYELLTSFTNNNLDTEFFAVI